MKIPGIPFIQGRNSYSDRDGRHYGIAIHCTANTASARAEAGYATTRTDGTSGHLYVDDVEVIQSLDSGARAGHAGSYEGNEHAFAVEIVGLVSWSREKWLASVAWDRLGYALAWLITNDPDYEGFEIRRASVAEMKANPKVAAFYDHNQMRLAWGGTTHNDPGPGFPWDRLLEAVRTAMKGDDVITDEDVAKIAKAVAGHVYGTGRAFYSHARDADRGISAARTELAALRTDVATALGRDPVDERAIVDGVLSGLATRPTEDVARALVAAGQDPAALAAALTALAGS